MARPRRSPGASSSARPTPAAHPTQLYEAAFHLLAAGILLVLWRRGLLRGQLIKLYIIAYLIYRFFSEFIRPEPEIWLGLTAYQWAAVALIPVFAALWIRDARSIVAQAALTRIAGDRGGRDWNRDSSAAIWLSTASR